MTSNSAPAWAEDARKRAEGALTELPALTGQEEEWRFTPPTDFGLEGPLPEGGAGDGTAPTAPDGRLAWVRFVDGVADVSDTTVAENGVIVGELGAALGEHEDLVRERLYSLVGFDDKPSALNAARWESGLFVYVPDGVEVELPVEGLAWATGKVGQVFDRTLVVAGRGSRVTVIDRYGSPDIAGRVSASSVVEVFAGEDAEVEHVSVIDWGAGIHHHTVIRAEAGRNAKVRSVVVTLGGDVVRVEPTMLVRGPGADARALGLYFADGHQHFEHRVIARHEAPQAYSNLLYKGAIKDTAHTVFFGNLVVPPGAPGTDAYQTNRNLVLNEGARADTIPFLEIETAEVKCSHAGAVSRVDDEHLFYLESRGVPRDHAKQLIVEGFCQEVLDEVGLEELRDELSAAIAKKVRR